MSDENYDIIIETKVGENSSKLKFRNAECYERYVLANTSLTDDMLESMERQDKERTKH